MQLVPSSSSPSRELYILTIRDSVSKINRYTVHSKDKIVILVVELQNSIIFQRI
jgi:hypothetical protein